MTGNNENMLYYRSMLRLLQSTGFQSIRCIKEFEKNIEQPTTSNNYACFEAKKSHFDKDIISSWLQNAKPWMSAIRNNEIKSRTLVTNKAITEAILQKTPRTVLDIGCGEGWLARALNHAGIETHGLDVVPELITEANKLGGGHFQILSYKNLSEDFFKEKFDVAVCNFSLLGNESVSKIFESVQDLLNDDGYFIVQTIHPIAGNGDEKYEDGWREGSWKDFNDQFTSPPPWYFRTLETWKNLFKKNGLHLMEIIEPLNPETKEIASIIFIGKIKTRLIPRSG